jgi:FtsP/CotA-like multicopper oxidase with cupredoxin domain
MVCSAAKHGPSPPLLLLLQCFVSALQTALFKLIDPGLFIYHCAAAPLPTHVANGMYGLVLVEPDEGLPPVDKEFCVVQSEVYAQEGEVGNVQAAATSCDTATALFTRCWQHNRGCCC